MATTHVQSSGRKHLLSSYIVGFVLSIALTVIAYTMATHHQTLNHTFVIGALASLAFAQFVAQLVFFLHVGTEQKARWKLVVLVTMIVVVGILVVGSLWIMSNLDHHMSTDQINTYMRNQDGL
ncbi:MAG TPA: cytochrome o ubiquinol oxidase subunit IV [Candidatus Saccharimonadales bacterium]|nr:cytochrome o ubiquinol oxidase subunit IV [Candidatus Saccharimonadales bacterium]